MKLNDLKIKTENFLKKHCNLDDKLLIAVSGGPDSMLLLHTLNNQNIVVAHVNYHKRFDSNIDEAIVRDYCNKHNIKCYVLNLHVDEIKGNFQNWARIKRYEFFKGVMQKENCKYLLTAHHKDDSLETAIIKEQSNRKSYYYGILSKSNVFNIEVLRPWVNLIWKSQIRKLCFKEQLLFADDYTNFENHYQRNKIRNSIIDETIEIKEKLLKRYHHINEHLNREFILEKQKLDQWSKKQYSQDFVNIETLSLEMIYLLLFEKFDYLNLSKSKVENIKKFILSSRRTSQFKLDNYHFIYKKQGKLLF
ncbi:tRNA(Ile)-lysidine synthase [Metamycoplasma cloacale]|uniref:tRNA(Ile)-lysidine synthase n=1 Tax=Metamycoplasma cloacale TaxID=92401 RepID=A0A2Z4LLE0_9BACT|nr:tRNA lysidine(34) synthetase TilS [Metamycoplasma cloacale]AWX42523.1 tRNA lysidine(34) synthetase TilS [Metamycoplasma cloacale]VEU79131.1 tRNA(Ile)-lysidine synthase [Metamycoplasma cloacale]